MSGQGSECPRQWGTCRRIHLHPGPLAGQQHRKGAGSGQQGSALQVQREYGGGRNSRNREEASYPVSQRVNTEQQESQSKEGNDSDLDRIRNSRGMRSYEFVTIAREYRCFSIRRRAAISS